MGFVIDLRNPKSNKAMKRILVLLFLNFSFSIFHTVHAQCPVRNTAFQDGEKLEYKLYFNWKFIWKTAGSATMNTQQITYKGQTAFQTDLITRTEKIVDRWFCMRDTLRAVYTTEIVPLHYRKGANEGGKYRLNKINYRYEGGQTFLHQYYRHGDGSVSEADNQTQECAFDMISMVMRCRSYKASDFTVGQRVPFLLADADRINKETLIYRGIKKFKAENKTTYRCLVFSYLETIRGKEKEVVTFYITDDENHLPVRLDLNLRFGTAKAYLKSATGLRNPETSIVEK